MMAYDDIIMAIDGKKKAGKVAFNAVKRAKNNDFISGSARLAWQKLSNKYASKSPATMVTLKGKFSDRKLKKRESPDEWITDLEEIQARLQQDFNHVISDEDVVIHILTGVTKEYRMQVSILEKRLNDTSNPLDIETLKTDLNMEYEKLYGSDGDDDSDDDDDSDEEKDQALAAMQFKGKCRACGKYGHKAEKCWSKKKDNNNGGGGKRFNGKCFYCKKPGHRIEDCFKRKREEGEGTGNGNNDVAEVVLMAKENKDIGVELSDNTWLGDTGASCHMRFNEDGMTEMEQIDEKITIGNGKSMVATKVGKWKGSILQENGELVSVVLNKVKVVPELWTNLLSIGVCMKEGWNIGNKGEILHLRKGSFTLVFNKSFNINGSIIPAMEMIPGTEVVGAALSEGKTIKASKLHETLGHVSEESTRKTAKYYGWKLTGKMDTCENCSLAKAKQKNLKKEKKEKSKTPGERLYMDISSIKEKSYGGSKFWLLVVDDCTDVCWSAFLKTKSELKNRMLRFVKTLQSQEGKKVKFVRCDNAGENRKFQEACEKEGLSIQFEYTAPGTPQQNGRVERKFATLYGRVRAMLNGARVPNDLRNGIWTECADTATKKRKHGGQRGTWRFPDLINFTIDHPITQEI